MPRRAKRKLKTVATFEELNNFCVANWLEIVIGTFKTLTAALNIIRARFPWYMKTEIGKSPRLHLQGITSRIDETAPEGWLFVRTAALKIF